MRGQVLIHLLPPACCFSAPELPNQFQAIESVPTVHSKFRSRSLMPRSLITNALPTRVEMKKIHKSSSGPNPVGNHWPPSRQ